jgi:hypothetical protein
MRAQVRLRRDTSGVGGAIEDLAALMVVVVLVLLFIVSITTIYRMRDDQDRRLDLHDLAMSFSRTVLSHPLLLEEPYLEEGLFSGAKLLALKEAHEDFDWSGTDDGGGDDQSNEDNPLKGLISSVHSEGAFGWELLFQDVSGYASQEDFTFSIRSTADYGEEVQSLAWAVNIFLDVGEVHAARLTVMVWEDV